MLFLPVGDGLIEVACWEPNGAIAPEETCHARAKALVDAKHVVRGNNGVRYRITGQVSDQCGASGESMLATIEAEGGAPAGAGALSLAASPPEVALELRAVEGNLHSEGPTPPQPPELLAGVAAVASRDSESGVSVPAAQLRVIQVVDADIDGDGTVDRLVSAYVETDDPSSYVWSGLVLAPGSRLDAAVTLWQSDLERFAITGIFDAERDGKLELLYAAEYYEGWGSGLARIVGGKLEFIGGYGCGA